MRANWGSVHEPVNIGFPVYEEMMVVVLGNCTPGSRLATVEVPVPAADVMEDFADMELALTKA